MFSNQNNQALTSIKFQSIIIKMAELSLTAENDHVEAMLEMVLEGKS